MAGIVARIQEINTLAVSNELCTANYIVLWTHFEKALQVKVCTSIDIRNEVKENVITNSFIP